MAATDAGELALAELRGIRGADGDEAQRNIGPFWVWLRVEGHSWQVVTVERWAD